MEIPTGWVACAIMSAHRPACCVVLHPAYLLAEAPNPFLHLRWLLKHWDADRHFMAKARAHFPTHTYTYASALARTERIASSTEISPAALAR